MRRLALISGLSFLLPSLSHAQEEGATVLLLEGGLRHFDYREHSDQGRLLDRENGFLPGLSLGVSHVQDAWEIAGRLSFHAGDVRYTGQTNTGEPIASTTAQQLTDIELSVGRRFRQAEPISPTLYVGASSHYWQRDIQPTQTASGTPVSGLLETYRWWQVFAGAKVSGYRLASAHWGLDARLTRTVAPEIKVDFRGLYDNLRLDLGERWGFRLALPVSREMRDSATFTIEPYWEKYALGRSASVLLASQGVVSGTVVEPEGNGRNYGMTFSIRKLY